MGNNQVSVKNLSFGYEKEKEIIKNVSISFPQGKITALLGANGCGKSTLLNLIGGVLKPNQGEVLLGDQSVAKMHRGELAKKIAMVHQNNQAPADMTVRKLVATGRTPFLKPFRGMTEEDEKLVEKAMAETEITAFADRPISSLSGGQLQRVWLSMALAQDTEILMLDEITTYLDIHYQLEILHLIQEMNRTAEKTVVMVLHDLNLAFDYCQEVVVMKSGEILAAGNMAETMNQQTLEHAFDVNVEIVEVGRRRQCVFGRRGDVYEK